MFDRLLKHSIVLVLGVALAGLLLPGASHSAPQFSDVDYERICRQTAHVPLVQAAIDPAFINVWTERQSRRAGRYEQYSYGSRRIDVRPGDDISLYHGLIHRTLDLIGESMWKYRDFSPDEDREHWLIYYTLEAHWPGAQRRQGEPSRTALRLAAEYWGAHGADYERINAKAAALATVSWCAANVPSVQPLSSVVFRGEKP